MLRAWALNQRRRRPRASAAAHKATSSAAAHASIMAMRAHSHGMASVYPERTDRSDQEHEEHQGRSHQGGRDGGSVHSRKKAGQGRRDQSKHETPRGHRSTCATHFVLPRQNLMAASIAMVRRTKGRKRIHRRRGTRSKPASSHLKQYNLITQLLCLSGSQGLARPGNSPHRCHKCHYL